MLAHVYYYAKAYYAALATGVLYLTTVIGPDIQFSDLGHVSLLHWFGFVGCVLGVGAGVAVVTNGDKPTPAPTADPASGPGVVVSAQAAPTSFAATQAKINALPEASAPEVTAPEVTAPAVETPAQ